MKKTVKLLINLSLILLFLLSYNTITLASSFSDFSAKAIIQENQLDTKQSYFDLRMSPNEQKTIQVLVNNNSDKTMKAVISLNPATTERNGVIIYTTDKYDESRKISITDIATLLNSEMTIAAKSSAYVNIALKMPEQPFNGVVLGGIVVRALSDDQSTDNQGSSNTQIKNQFAYTIGLKITQNDNPIKPDFHLKSITPSSVNYSPGLIVNLQNDKPVIVKGMYITAKVYKKGSNQVFKELSLPNVSVAPNSNFDVVVDWKNENFKPGTYRLKMQAEHNGETWSWDEEFSISHNNANEVNDTIIISKKSNYNLSTILNVALTLIIIVLLILFLKKKDNNDKKSKK